VDLRKTRVQESRARGTETLRRRRDGAWAISYTILNPICYDMTFNIAYDINIQYQKVFVQYQRHETSMSARGNPVHDLQYQRLVSFISNNETFDHDIEHLRYRYTNLKVQNVDSDIE
jgi:hypothetical protein